MTAPALPDIFGNYTLGDFVEVVSPESISWWPQTVGWAWLSAALLLWASHRAWRWLLHWYRNRYRGEAIAQLKTIPATGNMVVEINRLLKLTALAAYSRDQVASLSGEQWASFLNMQCPESVFDSAQQELLALAAYTGAPVAEADSGALLQASLVWVQRHKNPYDA